MTPLAPALLERHDSLFLAPHGDDVALACPARLLAEHEAGRRALVLALFEPVGSETAGVVIEAIDGEKIVAGGNWYPFLNRKAVTPVRLSLFYPAAGARLQETVKPISWAE